MMRNIRHSHARQNQGTPITIMDRSGHNFRRQIMEISNSNIGIGVGNTSSMNSPRSYSEESASISTFVQDHHVVVIRQAEEIRRLRRQLLEITNERDTLLCEVHHLKMGILASELGRLGELSIMNESYTTEDGMSLNVINNDSEHNGPSHVNMGTCVDDDLEQVQGSIRTHAQQLNNGIYSSSEMTRLSTSSSSSSASSSPVLFTTSSKSSSTQFHDSSEETGETGVVERRYGGPPARDAALVIQRAFRRYSMVKEFQRIKTERRLSRRINNNVPSAPGTNGFAICGDLETDAHHHVNDDEEICGDEEEDSIHSGELSRSPCPDVADVEVDNNEEHLKHCASNSHFPIHQQQWIGGSSSSSSSIRIRTPQLHPSHSSPQMLVSSSSGKLTQQHSSDSTILTSSRLPNTNTNTNCSNQQYHVPIQHLHAYQQQQHYTHPPGLPQGSLPIQYFHHHHLHHQNHHHPPPHHLIHTNGSPNISNKFPINRQPPGQHINGSLGSSPNSISSSSPVLVMSNDGSSPVSTGSNNNGNNLKIPPQRQMSDGECEIIRKRLYRVGLNLFNKKPEVGISYLVKKKFLEGTSSSVARFLISRKGLSKQMIGEYLANLQSPFSLACLEHFANEIDLSSLPIDLSLRRFQSFLRMPGEAQKIERIMETFSRRYAVCNPHVISQFRNGADTIFVMAFAIIMLNTDLHTPHLKQDRRMKMEDFIKNLRGIDDGGDIDREMLVSIYERIKQTEFRTGSDHVTQVMKVQQTIVGKKPNLALPHRRLVCYCRLYEVADLNKKEKSGSHQREVFLFNDILVLTKIFHKKRNSVTYSFRQSYPLAGITLLLFTNQYYDFGMCLKRGDIVLLNLNARNEHDRAKFAEDLREAIAESDEMGRIESLSKENRDSGVDVGKMKRFSNSLLDITDQCKPIRRGSCGSLDSGMSISFHSDELHQHQLSQQQSSVSSSSQSSCLTTSHPPPVHQHQGSSCSNSSSSTSHSK